MSPRLRKSLPSDDDLVRRLRRGDEDAFRLIHERYAAALERYAKRILGDRGALGPEDVVQEVFAKAHVALRADHRDIALRAWLYRLVRNRCLDELRAANVRLTEAVAGDELDAGGAAAEHASDPFTIVHRRHALRRTLADVAALPERQREVLLRREVDGLTHEELAGELGITVRASKNLVNRARENLTKAAEARDASCDDVRGDLLDAHDARRRASAHTYRHLTSCGECRAFRSRLGRVRGAVHGLLLPGPALLGVLASAIGAGGGGATAVGAVKLATASAVTVGIAGGALQVTTHTFASGDRTPIAVANAAVLGGAFPAGARLPDDTALVTHKLVLRHGVRRHPSVTLSCPPGMKVAGLRPDPDLRLGHGFDRRTVVGDSTRARILFEAQKLARDRNAVVGTLCKRPALSGSILAAPALAASKRVRRVCARRAYLFETPNGLPVGSVFRSQPVTLGRRTKNKRWTRVTTDAGTTGWIRTSALCR